MGVRQRRIQANYLKVDGVFKFLGTGFQTLDEKPSPKTTSKRYVNDASASQSITSYEWSSEFSADQIKSDDAIEYIVNIGEMCKTGSDAETEYIIADMDKPGAAANTYRARKFKVAIQCDDFKNNDGELQCNGSFLGLGDPEEGTITVDTETKAISYKNGFKAKATELAYNATDTISDISVAGITYDTEGSKFVGIPNDCTSFAFKDAETSKTATLTDTTWAIA